MTPTSATAGNTQMLKNLKVRTKLVAVLALPLVALTVMAAIGVRDRRAVAADAREGRHLAELTAARVDLIEQIQLERTWTAAKTSGNHTFGVDQLAEQRTRTNAAAAAFTQQSQGARGVSSVLREQIDKVATDLRQLGSMRETIDGGSTNQQFAIAYYNTLALRLSNLAARTAAASYGTKLQGDLATLGTLAAAKEAQAEINATVAQITVDGQGPGPDFDLITNAQRQYDDQERRFLEIASDAARADYQTHEQAADAQQAVSLLLLVKNAGPSKTVPVTASQWLPAANTRLAMLAGVEGTITRTVDATATKVEDDATKAARNFALGAALAVLASLLLASIVARSIARPLAKLTNSAYRLSQDQLPALVDHLKNPESDILEAALVPIDIDSRDEIGQLAQAFNSIQDVTQTVATEQASLLRKGIGEIFVNLARRNQTLLDRQIEFIDQLEAREEDPDQLENLFRLDHLATRMRRNAESLLVLAGAEPARRRGRPVDMADVVRVAIGEVEHFARITLLALDDATIGANVAVDLAHLLSELMENATQFSPPDSHVEIVGHKTRDGNYVVSVSDQGIGMSAEQLAEANRLMAHPPVVGLALSRSLGFIVIGRLAARFGIAVRLTSSPAGGVSALVSLPMNLIDVLPDPVAPAAPAEPLPPMAFDAPGAAPATAPVAARLDAPSTLEPPPAPPARPAEPVAPVAPAASADIAAFDGDAAVTSRSLPPLVDTPPPVGPSDPWAAPAAPDPPTSLPPLPPLPTRRPVEPPPPSPLAPPPAWPASPPAPHMAPPPPPPRPGPAGPTAPLPTRKPQPADAVAEGPITAAGLTRRVPKSTAPSRALSSAAPVTSTQRSPEEVRLMLSRYRSGLKRGRVDEPDDEDES